MWTELELARMLEVHGERLHEAEHNRLVRLAEDARRALRAQQPTRRPAAPVLNAVGRGLVALGNRLLLEEAAH